jgi:hypothetical protein
MNSIEISAITFGCVFGGALLGISIGRRLPEHHLAPETKDVVRLGMALVGTIGALVLSFFITSAKAYHDRQRDELTQESAKVALLGRILHHYGPEAEPARQSLKSIIGQMLVTTWPGERTENAKIAAGSATAAELYDQIEGLNPKDEHQRVMQSQASELLLSLGEVRWLMIEETTMKVSPIVLLVIIFWMTCIFVSWGLYSPKNATALTALMVSAFSVAAAILLIVELYTPYSGLLRVASEPLRFAYETLSQ